MSGIRSISTRDARFPIGSGHGSDAIHKDPIYSYAVTRLQDDQGRIGSGLAFTLGAGNQLVCEAAKFYADRLAGLDIEEIMADFGARQKAMADEQQFRWLGPHKGIVQLALASVTNACWDLWAKSRGVPLWKLLLDLTPDQIVATLDLSYLEDELTRQQALQMLRDAQPTRARREGVLQSGYPGYDTSVGWFNYPDEQVRENCKRALAAGFTAMKLKVGSPDPERDLRRANIVREVAGDQARVMLDANQQWTLPQALDICPRLRAINPFWIEEPTHPDDVLGHQTLARCHRTREARARRTRAEPRRLQELLAGQVRRVHPGGRRAGGGRERVPGRQFAVPEVWGAGRAACGRHGPTSPASRPLQSHRSGSRSYFSRTHPAPA